MGDPFLAQGNIHHGQAFQCNQLHSMITMNQYGYYIIVALLASCQCLAAGAKTNEWGPVTNNVKMSIRATAAEGLIKSNEAVQLDIVITNVSTNESFWMTFRWAPIEADPLFSFFVVTPSGRQISAQAGRDSNSSRAFAEVPPNRSNVTKFNLSRLCTFDEIGTYTITAKRSIDLPRVVERGFSVQRGFIVVSNPLSVTIVP